MLKSASLALVLLSLVLSGCFIDLGSLTRVQPLTESVVHGESGPKIVMLEFEGILTESPGRGTFGPPTPSIVARTQEALDRARDDKKVAALLLRVRSPGGTVAASDSLLHSIRRWKSETGKPVVVHMQGIATSGAYFISMAADHIVAQPSSVTGSIGVIMAGLNLSSLMDKVGITNQSMTSGAFKDSGSPLRPMRPEEHAQLQSVIDDMQERFVEVVDEGRPELDRERVRELADGRIYTARQALEVGLIDQIGFLSETISEVESRIGASESKVVIYHRPRDYVNNLYSRRDLPAIQVVDLNLIDFSNLLRPGFYFIWPPAMGLSDAN